MTQTVPATAVLGPGKTGLTIGYRVLNLDGTEYSAFTTTGVAETSTAGTYRVAGGVVAPLAGGYIVWGEAATDYAEATVESTSANVTYQAGTALSAQNNLILADVMRWIGTDLTTDYATVVAYANDDGNISLLNAEYIRDSIGIADADMDDQLDTLATSVASCASVAANSTDATASGAITRKRGNSWSIALTLGEVTGYTSLWFSVKRSYDDADSAAVLQVKLNSPSAADGLLYVNGVAATDATKASITVSNAGTGAIVIAVDETITDDIAPGTYYYDAQALITGAVTTPDSGTFTVTADVTRSVL